ncbi:MAG: S8 family serine peptidase [Candidatus Sumerlaeia bacterium]|nr:S8 family serine peptidase [Candidatus Sumerlaeia bacterium]
MTSNRLRRRAALAALASLLAAAPPLSAADPHAVYTALRQDPAKILLEYGEVDPAREALPAARLFSTAEASRAESSGRYFLVQFNRAATPADLDERRARGWEFLGYVPNNAYFVRLPGAASRAVPQADPLVRWADRWHGGYKASQALRERAGAMRSSEPATVLASLWPGEDAKAAAEALQAAGLEPLGIAYDSTGGARISVSAAPENFAALADLEAVRWLEPMNEITTRNDFVTTVVQSGEAVSNGSRPVWAAGLTGTGEIIGHMDGAIIESSCFFDDSAAIGPGHRKMVLLDGSGGDTAHGTHTAGTAAGLNLASNTNRGVAHNAKIAHGNTGLVTNIGNATAPSTFDARLLVAQNAGAFVHTNSWGNDAVTSYTNLCEDIDRFSWDNEDALIVFAATNTSTLKTPENAKNVLAVGSTRRTNINAVSTGGAGPTSDGRLKPEIFAPGENTVSASTSTCSTASSTGTSMACPAVTGAGILVREYFRKGFHPGGAASGDGFIPSGALIKAVLLNGTVDMTSVTGYPSNAEGWGRLLLDNALYFDGDTRTLYVADYRRSAGEGLGQGATRSESIRVTSTAEPLRVTLAFMDPAASIGASSAPINNLDLEVVSPSGATYRGNVFTGGFSSTGGSADTLNNVEVVSIAAPEAGEWTITVRGTTVNALYPSVGYAIAANGAIGPGGRGALSLSPGTATCGDTVTVTLRDGNATGGTQQVALASDSGDTETLALPAMGDGVHSASFTIAQGVPAAGNGTLEGTSGGTFSVTYEDADAGEGAPAEIATTGALDCDAPEPVSITLLEVRDTTAIWQLAFDEPASGTFTAGTACGDSTYSAPLVAAAAPNTYTASLAGLPPGTLLRGRAEVQDSIGNSAVLDAGGACFPFTTLAFQRTAFFDMEPDSDGITTALISGSTGANWQWVTYANSASPTHSMFGPNINTAATAAMATPQVQIPAGGGLLRFKHTFQFESGSWDGGIIEVQPQGSGAWSNLGPRILAGGYNGTLASGTTNPLAGIQGFVGGTLGQMTEVVVDLSPWAGQSVSVRWRTGSDGSVGGSGWYVDDIEFGTFTSAVPPATETGWQVLGN